MVDCQVNIKRRFVNFLFIVLIDFSLSVKVVTFIFISGRCSASSSAKQEKSGLFVIR